MNSNSRIATAARSSVRTSTKIASTRQAPSYASRALDRAGPTSPTGSIASTATTGTKRKDREFDSDHGTEETNINVVVRCRGRNEREIRENSNVVVNADAVKGHFVELSMGPNALSNRSYNFDRVFSPAADQNMVFDDTVKPILEEVRLIPIFPSCPLCVVRPAYNKTKSIDACWLQLYYLCLWPDWYWKDIHNVR